MGMFPWSKNVEEAKTLEQQSADAISLIETTAQNLVNLNDLIEMEQGDLREDMMLQTSQYQKQLADLNMAHVNTMAVLHTQHDNLNPVKERNARIAQRFMELIA